MQTATAPKRNSDDNIICQPQKEDLPLASLATFIFSLSSREDPATLAWEGNPDLSLSCRENIHPGTCVVESVFFLPRNTYLSEIVGICEEDLKGAPILQVVRTPSKNLFLRVDVLES